MSRLFDWSKIRVLLRRGSESQVQPARLELGEIAYSEDTKKLWVGDGTGGAQHVANVIEGPHDGQAYAKLENRDKLIPLYIRG